jgi:hypothetical protein
MDPSENKVKQVIPPPVWAVSRSIWYWLNRTWQLPTAVIHPWRRDSIRQLAALKDMHHGQRCFIIGNGPSLNQTDLTRLRQEVTFGTNRIYLAFPKLGFSTSYYVSINDLVIEQCLPDILALPALKFLSWRSRRFFHRLIIRGNDPAGTVQLPVFLHTTYTGQKFSRDARGRLWEGATVTYVALQLAFHMGFQQVILVGVDHNYTTSGRPNTTVVSTGDDPNHFNASYFGKGFRWQLPDLIASERSYRLARRAYESVGRQVLDATVGGKLTVFPKINYETLF